jgi:hypothetical protein
MSEVSISTDCETDGPIPGPHSLLSFASAAFLPNKTLLGTFSANLEPLPGAQPDPRTWEWWQSQPEAWAACRSDLQPPDKGMLAYLAWLKKPYRETTKRGMPRRWFDPLPHSHVALDDAIEQGCLFCNMRAENPAK